MPEQTSRPVVNIVGSIVALGPMVAEHKPLFHRWLNDMPTLNALGDALPPWTAQQQDAWYEREHTTPDLIPFTIYLVADWRPIGTTALLGVDLRHRSAEFGIIIGDPGARGRGAGTEVTVLMRDFAFDIVGLHSLYLGVYEFNVAGIRAYERAGFREVGRRRQCYRSAGRRWDNVLMECIAADRSAGSTITLTDETAGTGR